MMSVCYYSLSLYLLLITHWTNAATLHHSSKWPLDRRQPSSLVDTDAITQEPVLHRRRPYLISPEREKRWLKDDEEEIPIDETAIDPLTTTLTTENPSTVASDDTSTSNSPLQTDELTTTSNEINSTESEISSTKEMDVNQETSSETAKDNTTETQEGVEETSSETMKDKTTEIASTFVSTQKDIEETSTSSQVELSTVTGSNQDTTNSPTTSATTDATQTSTDYSKTETLSESSTTVLDDTTSVTNEEVDTTTIAGSTMNLDVAENTTEVITDTDSITTFSDVIQNETSTVIDENSEYSNETIDSIPSKPICDESCQCIKKCHYGFQIINNTCICDPPCTKYKCFGNDTCSVSKEGKPVCQPEEGSEHDRPLRCYQPTDDGYHDDDMRYHDRWYYNPDEDACHSFVYRGLGGNENNFQTKHKCHLECIICAPPFDPGSCQAYIPVWYYDYKKNECSPFHYTGCKGNENRFFRKQQCIDTCITRILNI